MRGIAKFVARTKTSILQSTGNLERTVDAEFDEKYTKMKIVKNSAEQLNHSATEYLIAMSGLLGAQAALVTTLDTTMQCSEDPLRGTVTSYRDTMVALDTELRCTLESALQATVLKPIERYSNTFRAYCDLASKRKNKLLDYDAAKSHVQNSTIVVPKAETDLLDARASFEAYNTPLLADLPRLVAMRLSCLPASIEAFVQANNTLIAMNLEAVQRQVVAAEQNGLHVADSGPWEPCRGGDIDTLVAKLSVLSICCE